MRRVEIPFGFQTVVLKPKVVHGSEAPFVNTILVALYPVNPPKTCRMCDTEASMVVLLKPKTSVHNSM